jgi:hypothetical protein
MVETEFAEAGGQDGAVHIDLLEFIPGEVQRQVNLTTAECGSETGSDQAFGKLHGHRIDVLVSDDPPGSGAQLSRVDPGAGYQRR